MSATGTRHAERADVLAELEADADRAATQHHATVSTLAPAALEAALADEQELADNALARGLRLLERLTEQQLWDLGEALQAISLGRAARRNAQNSPGVRTTSGGTVLRAVSGGVA